MMTIKNAADIQKMQAAGRVVEGTLALMGRLAKPGLRPWSWTGCGGIHPQPGRHPFLPPL